MVLINKQTVTVRNFSLTTAKIFFFCAIHVEFYFACNKLKSLIRKDYDHSVELYAVVYTETTQGERCLCDFIKWASDASNIHLLWDDEDTFLFESVCVYVTAVALKCLDWL